ncbi:FHA domain-containing protein [Myxococcaceae bacterium GXIMD 01537]
MIEQNPRPARKVGIADHLWETYEEMAQQMGSDRDALINQALFMFARLNGFIEVGKVTRVESPVVAAAPAPVAAVAPSRPAVAPAPPPNATPRPAAAPTPVLAAKPAPPPPREEAPPPRPPRLVEERAPANALDDDPVRREVAERVLETAAELERLIKGKNESQPPPEEVDELPEEEDESLPEPEDPNAGMDDMPDEPADEPMDEEPAEEEGGSLYLVTENGEEELITVDRFIIGRGKHCNYVINSGKVSREHAVIFNENGEWFIEDLGSSNGTWYNKQRIKRRKVEDGDEYFVCSEKVKLLFR